MNKPAQYTVISLLVLFVIFVLQNMEAVSVAFLFWSFSMPRSLLLCITLLIGFAIGLLLGRGRRMLFK